MLIFDGVWVKSKAYLLQWLFLLEQKSQCIGDEQVEYNIFFKININVKVSIKTLKHSKSVLIGESINDDDEFHILLNLAFSHLFLWLLIVTLSARFIVKNVIKNCDKKKTFFLRECLRKKITNSKLKIFLVFRVNSFKRFRMIIGKFD